jgi:hypothetical protein
MVGSAADVGSSNTVLGVTGYREPAMQPRIQYAPSSLELHGDLALGWTWQQTILGFEVAAFSAASEQASRDAVAELLAAITQGLEFDVSVTVGDADPEVWTCNPGTLTPTGDRSSADLRRHTDPWSVTLPAYPVRG